MFANSCAANLCVANTVAVNITTTNPAKHLCRVFHISVCWSSVFQTCVPAQVFAPQVFTQQVFAVHFFAVLVFAVLVFAGQVFSAKSLLYKYLRIWVAAQMFFAQEFAS